MMADLGDERSVVVAAVIVPSVRALDLGPAGVRRGQLRVRVSGQPLRQVHVVHETAVVATRAVLQECRRHADEPLLLRRQQHPRCNKDEVCYTVRTLGTRMMPLLMTSS